MAAAAALIARGSKEGGGLLIGRIQGEVLEGRVRGPLLLREESDRERLRHSAGQRECGCKYGETAGGRRARTTAGRGAGREAG